MATSPSKPTTIVAASVALVLALVALASGTSASAASPGPLTVTFRGASFQVPTGWPVYDLAHEPGRCVRLDVPAVYLGHQGPEARCPARPLGKTTALQLEPLDAAVATESARATQVRTIGAWRIRLDPADGTTHSIAAAIDQVGIFVTLTFGQDRHPADRILDTMSVAAPRASPTRTTARPSPNRPTPRPSPTRPTPAPQPPPSPTPFIGLGFDTCTAPSAADLQAWLGSPYRAVGVYIGGANRACPDGNLSASWVSAVEALGWSLIPTYVGLQAPCTSGFATIDPANAAAQGAVSASDAVSRAHDFGLGPGTTLYFDMEAYDPTGGPCSSAVTTFVKGWSDEIRRQGYVPGVYCSLESGLPDLANTPGAQPDQIWFAIWDGLAGTSHPAVAENLWYQHQRIKQFLGGHTDTYGGVTLNVDVNALDAILRTPPPPPPPAPASPTPLPNHRSPSPTPRPSPRPRPSFNVPIRPNSPY